MHARTHLVTISYGELQSLVANAGREGLQQRVEGISISVDGGSVGACVTVGPSITIVVARVGIGALSAAAATTFPFFLMF